MANPSGFDVRRQSVLTFVAIACFVLMCLPIILLVIYSSNVGYSIAI